MNTIHWAVACHLPPAALRHCKKCGCTTAHQSSGLFRVNAQQKCLDIWLIYRCPHCQGTWKSTIYTHISPKAIPVELLGRFTANDEALAAQYAMDVDLLKRNGAAPGDVRYEIVGEDIPPGTCARIVVESPYPVRQSLAKLLRQRLSLSKRAFDAMVDAGMIAMEDGSNIAKARLHRQAIVLYRPS